MFISSKLVRGTMAAAGAAFTILAAMPATASVPGHDGASSFVVDTVLLNQRGTEDMHPRSQRGTEDMHPRSQRGTEDMHPRVI